MDTSIPNSIQTSYLILILLFFFFHTCNCLHHDTKNGIKQNSKEKSANHTSLVPRPVHLSHEDCKDSLHATYHISFGKGSSRSYIVQETVSLSLNSLYISGQDSAPFVQDHLLIRIYSFKTNPMD